jgi:hypothetical protein
MCVAGDGAVVAHTCVRVNACCTLHGAPTQHITRPLATTARAPKPRAQHLQDSQQAIELAADQHTKALRRVAQVGKELQAATDRCVRVCVRPQTHTFGAAGGSVRHTSSVQTYACARTHDTRSTAQPRAQRNQPHSNCSCCCRCARGNINNMHGGHDHRTHNRSRRELVGGLKQLQDKAAADVAALRRTAGLKA